MEDTVFMGLRKSQCDLARNLQSLGYRYACPYPLLKGSALVVCHSDEQLTARCFGDIVDDEYVGVI